MYSDVKSLWTDSGGSKKALLIAGIVAVVSLFIFLSLWTLRDDYQVLFSDLDPEDAAHMVAELDRLKTPYKLADNATTILVDRDAVYKTRLKLMGKGLTLRGNVGFELFNNADYGTTEFAQKVNYQRALQGELARTIMAIEEVKYARVHLVLPERGILKKQVERAKASVSLATKNGAQLSPEQVVGIQRLVAAAAPDMEASAVTVLDQRGTALTPNVVGDSTGTWSTGKIEVKKEIEIYFTKKISGLLDKALGPGKALVSVDVTLNYDHSKVTSEEAITVPERRKGTVEPVARKPQMVPPLIPADGETKTASVAVIVQDASEANTQIKSASTSPETHSSRRVEQIVSEPGSIRRISVGIFVPANLSAEVLTQVREVVVMAAGLNLARGDAISIQPVAQPSDPISEANTAANAGDVAAEGLHQQSDHLSKSQADKTANRHELLSTSTPPLLFGVGILLIVLGCIALSRRSPPANRKKNLSPEEREKLLKQISEWTGATSIKQSASEKV